MFGRKPYPILPTSESDTLTFLQKLDMLEYKVSTLNNKIYEIETSLATKSSVSATASDDVIQTITIDGTTLDVPQGTEVSATGSEGTLETLTVDGTTYNVPQGGGSSDVLKGNGYLTDGVTQIAFKWTLIYDKIFITIPEGLSTLSSTSVNVVFTGLTSVRAFTSYCDVSYYTIAEGSIAYVHVGTLVMTLFEGINSGTFRYTNNQAVNITGSSTALYSVTAADYNNLKGKTLCFDFPRV